MLIEQIYTHCLAEASYYIESEGEAIVIDPIRETDPYVRKAAERGTRIRYVFETHFHADFISGHIDLAAQTGAKIVFGPQARPGYDAIIATDNQEFRIGKITLRVLHTPGHTPESSCFLLLDAEKKPHALFTGDTLFVGDVGRPDLLDGLMSKEELAGMLYDSLNTKIKTLPDEVIVYPGHGPGSACGKNIGTDTWSTIGAQKKANYALQDMSRQAFIDVVTEGLSAPPKYFFASALTNKQGYESIDAVMNRNVSGIPVSRVKEEIANGAVILDTRPASAFAGSFIPGSVEVGLDGSFAVWVGTVLDPKQRLVVVAPEGREKETILRLARVGFENVAGYLEGGMAAWENAGEKCESIENLSAENFFARTQNNRLNILDVRKVNEYASGHLVDARNIPLSDLENRLVDVDTSAPLYIHCAGGYRSMIAASLMHRKGFRNLINIDGGWGKIKETGITIVQDFETA